MTAQLMRGTLFDNFFRDFPALTPGYFMKPLQGAALPAPGRIRIDVKENDESYTVQAELPGVTREQIDISIDDNVVTLRAEVRQENEVEQDEHVLRTERYYGEVARSFQLPQDVDRARAKARYDQGVLTLTLPKKPTGGSRHLRVE